MHAPIQPKTPPLRRVRRALMLVVPLALVTPFASAQRGGASQSSVDVSLTSGYAKLGEEVRIVIRATVSGNREVGGLESIELPEVEGLDFGRVMGPSTSSRFEMDGRGRMVGTQTLTYAVAVAASRVGTFEIPRFPLRIDGRDITAPDAPMTLKVLEDIEGSRALVLELEELPARVFEGEPYTFDLTIGWSMGVRGGSVLLQIPWWGRQDGVIELQPQLTGAERGFPIDRRGRSELAVSDLGVRDRDGAPYQLYRLRRRFVATRPGTVSFPRTVLEVSRGRGRDALYQVVPEFSIEVVPVPEEGRPLDWTGAVGPIEVSRDAQRRDIDLGDSLELSVRYSGSGNLEFFEAPKLERVEGFERFRVLASTDEKTPFMRAIEYELVPMGPDVTEVPPIPLSVFDPESGGYVTIATEPMTIRVSGAASDEEDPFAGLGSGEVPEGRAPTLRDIQPRPVTTGPRSTGGGPGAGAGLIALLVAFGGWVTTRRAVRRSGDPGGRRARAKRGALRALRRELRGADGPGARALALERFLAARTGTSPGEWIGRSSLVGSVDGASAALERSFTELRERLDRAAYQGGAAAPGDDEVVALARRIVQEVR
ncbi:MAG: BatD family protein [Planctomycetota bacterium]|nr:BatD family protein [Planctomycetota bacterium]